MGRDTVPFWVATMLLLMTAAMVAIALPERASVASEYIMVASGEV